MTPTDSTAILHIGLHPHMGTWSVMQTLARGQRASGRYAAVGMGVVVDSRWPSSYYDDLAACVDVHYVSRTLPLFGTARTVWQLLHPPPIESWIRDLALKRKTDRIIVHFHAGWQAGVFLPLPPLEGVKVACCSTFHGINPILNRQPVRRWVHRAVAGRLGQDIALVSVDTLNPKLYERLLGLPRSRFEVIPNGIADTDKRGCPFLRGAKRFTLGYVGRISADKGWRIVADAHAMLLSEGRPVNLILAGTGPEADEARAFRHANPDTVRFDGFAPNARDSVMPEFDCLLLPSRFEACPMTTIEAMSLGVPCAAAPVGDIPRQIIDGHTGFLVSHEPREIADLVASLMDNPSRLGDMSREARTAFEEHFHVDHMVSRYHTRYMKQAGA